MLEGITVGGKSLREHFEATNHRDAILFVEEIVGKNEALTEWQIRNIHSLVLKSIDEKDAGRYRQENVVIAAGASTIPPDFLLLQEEMKLLIVWHEQVGQMHVVERASELHTRFVKIHPFIDGNGRRAAASELRVDEGGLSSGNECESWIFSSRCSRRRGYPYLLSGPHC